MMMAFWGHAGVGFRHQHVIYAMLVAERVCWNVSRVRLYMPALQATVLFAQAGGLAGERLVQKGVAVRVPCSMSNRMG